MPTQLSMFGEPGPALPDGFRYEAELITPDEERALLEHVRQLPFEHFQFQGYIGKRRVVSFGWHYSFTDRLLRRTDDVPGFLLPLRERAAAFARMPAARLQQVLVTEYDAGAAIGWHRDKAVFGEVVGVSLLASCTFRLRRAEGDDWARVSLTAEPRSVYLLSGPARTEWEHSIPAVDALRYSITFRNLRSE
jgi:alkylated DNA repair dioxygenase AlkB